MHVGMHAFAAALADEGLLGLCDTILEALHFCPGFQTCLTCGESTQSLDIENGHTSAFATQMTYAKHVLVISWTDTVSIPDLRPRNPKVPPPKTVLPSF